ncbi:MAG: four-carbon acid sugar kinase family protein [Acidimicrobiales bacterium]
MTASNPPPQHQPAAAAARLGAPATEHEPVDAGAFAAGRPAPWPHDPWPDIVERVAAAPEALVVLDDDPTGTQTVHGVAVLTTWDVDRLADELARSRCFFVLTNSRALPVDAAVALAEQIGANLRLAAERTGTEVAVVSRSDSTLRGHFPAEVDAVAAALGRPLDAVVLAPWFLDGGRVTLDGIHYARTGDRYVPVGRTEFAADASFGYTRSWLPAWVEEKTAGRVPAAAVTHLPLAMVREGGPDAVTAALLERPPGAGGYVSADALDERDVAVVVAGLLGAEAAGRRYLYRTGASFVRVRAAIGARPFLDRAELGAATGSGRLLVVGSHVGRSSEQLERVLALPHVRSVELAVDAALRDPQAEGRRVAAALDAILAAGGDAVLWTSRSVRTGADAAASLAISATVSAAVVAAVRGLTVAPRLLVAKGGITSSDVATEALGVRRALVVGQAQAGVPVWELGPESRFPAMRYVVFPGNVGTADSLAELLAAEG